MKTLEYILGNTFTQEEKNNNEYNNNPNICHGISYHYRSIVCYTNIKDTFEKFAPGLSASGHFYYGEVIRINRFVPIVNENHVKIIKETHASRINLH
jgi:hypothetical protein